MRLLVTGATGYVGGRLVPRLVDAGHHVVCLARDPARLPLEWRDQVEACAGDAGDVEAVAAAAAGADAAAYLVHSLGSGGFAGRDRELAAAFRDGCAKADVGRIVYLGGLGRDDDDLSPHLRSRHEVGAVLADGPVPVAELRAALVIGSGSASFEMLRSLVETLPVMVTPRWVNRTRCQPIAIADVLVYLQAALERPELAGRVLEVGGPDVLTYRQMMDVYAEVAGLRPRVFIPVPVVTPRLSAYWVNLVTPLPFDLAAPLVEGQVNDVVVTDPAVRSLVDHETLTFRESVARALARIQDRDVPTRWTWRPSRGREPAAPWPDDAPWAGGALLEDVRTVTTTAPAPTVFAVVEAIGGANGWYGLDWMWQVRGVADRAFGGIGLRRGRRTPAALRVGDGVDFWVVEQLVRPELVRLRAEMRLPGAAWLEWRLSDDGSQRTLEQRARFAPRGLFGRAYWSAMVPFHHVLFPRLANAIVARAEAASGVQVGGGGPGS